MVTILRVFQEKETIVKTSDWCETWGCTSGHIGYRNVEIDICNFTKELLMCRVDPKGSSISVYDIKYKVQKLV